MNFIKIIHFQFSTVNFQLLKNGIIKGSKNKNCFGKIDKENYRSNEDGFFG